MVGEPGTGFARGVKADGLGGSEGFVEEGLKLGAGQGADLGGGDLAVLEQHQGGNAADAILGCAVGVFVDVQLGDGEAALVLGGGFVEQGGDHFAGATPFGPVVDQDGQIGLEHVAGKGRV